MASKAKRDTIVVLKTIGHNKTFECETVYSLPENDIWNPRLPLASQLSVESGQLVPNNLLKL